MDVCTRSCVVWLTTANPSLLMLLCTTPPQVSILSWLFSSVVVSATLVVKTFFNELFFRHTTTLLKNKNLPKISFFLIFTTSCIYAAFYLLLDTGSTLHSSYATGTAYHHFIDGLQLALCVYNAKH